jgi:hypothetical protein
MTSEQRRQIGVGDLNAMADALNRHIYHFNNRMAEIIRSGATAEDDPGARCEFTPATPAELIYQEGLEVP